ncbi:hypothetical protein BRC87_07105 [Halobacteriales archaeon QS_4_66_20]|nr:MAG: hypothetical protein BRC87_07105 [Halobacteriales archaeon QS_4_66_20]PSQ34654.1 MAG: hypothetical protein BRD08_09100 [Halobacteriales archaeon SW_10_66_29]
MIPALLNAALGVVPLATKLDPWEVIPPGMWLIFGVIGLPVYVAFLGWFLGKPRQLKTSALGVTLFLTLVTALWGGLFATTLVIRIMFFG